MITAFIVFLGLIAVFGIIANLLCLKEDDFVGVGMAAIIIVVIFTIILTAAINIAPEYKVKYRVIPKVVITNTIEDSKTVTDTTYIYTFKP